MKAPDPVIRASEIGQYAFCARAWWLGRVKGYRSANVEAMQHGTALHIAHGQAVQRAHTLRFLALALLLLAAAASVAWLILGLAL